MASIDRTLTAMRGIPTNDRYADLHNVCEHYFGAPRTTGGSHAVLRPPWSGDPRVNTQNDQGTSKPYQVLRVLAAIGNKEAN